VPGPGGTRMGTDPEVSAVIRSAAGTLRARAAGSGVTAGDITDMISTLRGDLAKGGIEGRTAERAINHLQDMLDTMNPAAGAAAREMSEAYAARSRMAEGMSEGNATRLRDDVQVGTSRRQARTVRNAYDSPEGASGRSLGQSNRITNDLGGSPEEALRATVKQSRGSTGRQLAQNLGPAEADRLAVAARAQDESAQALAAASNKAQSGSGDSADAETLVQAIAGLHPSSFITTKAGAMRRLLDMTYVPEGRARTMIDMLFSQDPALMRRALQAIGNEPNGAKFTKYLSTLIGQAGGNSTSGDSTDMPELGSSVPSVEDDLNSAGGEESAIEAPDVGDSPYGEALQNLYATENPDLIQLVQRVKGQESGGHQIDPKTGQPTRSSAGAIGVMQVMPGTGPEAAALAGLPWDENAYRTDAAYNELIGIAYLAEQLRKYDGDVERALAAYNAGPDRTDEALANHGENWLASLPAETQDYVARVA
jgi:Transglycosylase SLT domain